MKKHLNSKNTVIAGLVTERSRSTPRKRKFGESNPLLFLLLLSLPLFAPAQQVTWAKAMGNTGDGNSGDNIGLCVKTDALGNVYTTGFFMGTVDFDPGQGTFNLTSSTGHVNMFISKLDASGNFVWAKVTSGLGDAVGYSAALDAEGNIYLTGYFSDTIDFDPGPGTFNLTSTGYRSMFVSKLDASGNFVWAKTMSSSGSAYGMSIALDAGGNIYTTGDFNDTIDFDPGPGIFNLTGGGGFVSKLNAEGNLVWAKAIGGTGCSVVTDATGNVYTTGGFSDTVDFDPGAGVFNLTSAGHSDIFVSKLDASGSFVWVKAMGGGSSDFGNSIAVDAGGNIYTTGYFSDTVDFDPGQGTFNLTGSGFVSKLDASGSFVWAKAMGGWTGYWWEKSMTLDAEGNVYTTGRFSDTVDFDPGPGTFNLTAAGNADSFVSKLTANGSFVWAQSMGGSTSDDLCEGLFITTDATGNIYVAGEFWGTAQFGSQMFTSAGYADIFVLKMDGKLTGVAQLSMNSERLSVWPNPNNTGILHIESSEKIESIELFNVFGQCVFKPNNTKSIDVSGFAKGMYMLRVSNNEGSALRKVIIQ